MTVRNDKSPKMNMTVTFSRKKTEKLPYINTDMPLDSAVPDRFMLPRYGPALGNIGLSPIYDSR